MKAILLRFWGRLLIGLGLAGLAAGASWHGRLGDDLAGAAPVSRPALIQPDYSGLVVPPNLAPLNFSVQEEGVRYSAIVRGKQGAPIQVRGGGPVITIPQRPWTALLRANQGGELYFDVYVKTSKSGWRLFNSITNTVAEDPVDPYLFYRKIYPYHNSWSSMGLYQRSLETYEERALLETDCVHCHSVCDNDPSRFSVDIRSETFGNSLLMVHDGKVEKILGTVGMSAWHPSGRLLASSFNKPRLVLHSQQNDMRDIVDFDGWLGYFAVGSNIVRRIPTLVDEGRVMTCPVWSPDGRFLYFCSAPRLFKDFAELFRSDLRQVKYDLLRVSYDMASDQWGHPEMILSSQTTGLSAAQPRISPDGRWLTFCLCAYGCWPTYQPGSDLYAIDLKTGPGAGTYVPHKLEVNSEECESWHNWSSNSRWIVFSSKRGNPLFNRPYLAHVDANGKFSKPFLVPQSDPAFYSANLKTFTIPTLAAKPFPFTQRDLIQALSKTNSQAFTLPAGRSQQNPGGHDSAPAMR
jgi:hypothetical protein